LFGQDDDEFGDAEEALRGRLHGDVAIAVYGVERGQRVMPLTDLLPSAK
jgi:hypothetical protein